jgi:PepSY-associated TM region
MSRYAIAIRKWIILSHRWMGVVFCPLFLAWFASGILMMYCRFPRVDPAARLAREASIDPSAIRISPAAAFAQTGSKTPPSALRFNLLDGRPVYRFSFGRRQALVFADTGERLDTIPADMALKIAAQWAGISPHDVVSQSPITAVDQWTVYSSVRPYGPFLKSYWPNGEEIYISQATGEVVQDTTPRTRLGAYFGAIPHWLYFTWLRANAPLWTQVVIWLSGIGTAVALLGMIVGVWMYSPSKRYAGPGGVSRIPYAGFKRWHMVLGLIFGAFTCTWAFSGLLSMGPFSWLTDATRVRLDKLSRPARIELKKFAAKGPGDVIAEVGAALQVKELEWSAFNGEPMYIARQAPSTSRIIPVSGQPREALDADDVVRAVQQTIAPVSITAKRLVTSYEPYYVDRENERPLPVLFLQLNDSANSAFYIDPKTGAVIQSYGVRSRWNRWLYHGLHSMDLPWLYAHRPAWDIMMLCLMLGGVAVSATSVVIAWQVIRRTFRSPRPARRLVAQGGSA